MYSSDSSATVLLTHEHFDHICGLITFAGVIPKYNAVIIGVGN